MKRQAMFYEKIKDTVHCLLCPNNCVIENENFGDCNVRTNENGELYTINYGEITSISLDPIEKKPLNHFKPSTHILSVGSFGCNFHCGFCQNYMISQFRAESEYVSAENLVNTALETKDNIGLAFTYNEPTVWFEYMYDCAKLLKEIAPDKSVVLVTNGYINEGPLKAILPFVDAMNIDLKSLDNEYYRKICKGSLLPILKTIKTAEKDCHVEVTTLLVSGENDTLEEVEEIAMFLNSINDKIPLHLSRYFPNYKFNNPPTDLGFMKEAEKVAKKYLQNVHLGNV